MLTSHQPLTSRLPYTQTLNETVGIGTAMGPHPQTHEAMHNLTASTPASRLQAHSS